MSGDAMLDAFFEQEAELLAGFEAGLLELESAPDTKKLLNRIFRCAHTLKGNSSMLGFERVTHFTDALKDMLVQLRKGDLEATPVVIDTLLASSDIMKGLVEEAKGGDAVDAAQHDKVHAAIKVIVKGEMPAEAPATAPDSAAPSAAQKLFQIRFTPPEDLFSRGLDPIKCLETLAELGQFVQCNAETGKLPALEELDPEECYLSWKIWHMSAHSEPELRGCFDFIADDNAVAIELLPLDDDREAEASPSVSVPTTPAASAVSTTAPEAVSAPIAPPTQAPARAANQVIREFSQDKLHGIVVRVKHGVSEVADASHQLSAASAR